MDKIWKVVKEKVWPVIRAMPAILFKTKAGKWLVGMVVTAILRKYFPEITFEQVSNVIDVLTGMAFGGDAVGTVAVLAVATGGILFGNEKWADVKKIIERTDETSSDTVA